MRPNHLRTSPPTMQAIGDGHWSHAYHTCYPKWQVPVHADLAMPLLGGKLALLISTLFSRAAGQVLALPLFADIANAATCERRKKYLFLATWPDHLKCARATPGIILERQQGWPKDF